MANIGDIAKGLKLLIRGLDFQLTGTAGPADITNRAAEYSIQHLEGIICPYCKEVGTICRFDPIQKRDVGMVHGLIDPTDKKRLAWLFDTTSFINTDMPSGLNLPDQVNIDDMVMAQEDRKKQIEAQGTGWICFHCIRKVETTEFISQLHGVKV